MALMPLAAFLIPNSAEAQSRSITFIRDAEVEHTIRTYSTPILESAGLNPDSVRIYIIENRDLNAFVAGGQRMFFHTGLIMSSETPLDIIGVIAHEAGHIAGGHLIRTREALAQAVALQVAGVILGAGAALATGDGGAGLGVMAAGQGFATQNFLAYSRAQESAADNAALAYLEDNNLSARGLQNILKKLEGQELLTGASQNPYVRSHPISRDRLALVQRHMSQEPADLSYPPEWDMMHQRMLAKMRGFLWREDRVYREYPETDQSFPARYARSIADHLAGRTEQAQRTLDDLLLEAPNDPYVYSLKGQFAFENNEFDLAVQMYEKASTIAPEAYLIQTFYGQALVVLNTQESSEKAIEVLENSVRIEPDQSRAWHNLAILYGRLGEQGKAALAAAERFYRANDREQANRQVSRALGILPVGSPEHQRALDIEFALKASEQ